LAVKFKGSLSTQILIDRARILTKEKKRAFIDILKNNINYEKSQVTFTSTNNNYIEELEREKIHKEKIVDKLNLQKEILKNKIICQEGQGQRNSHMSNSSINDSVRKAVCTRPIDLKKIIAQQESDEDEIEEQELSNKIASNNKNFRMIKERHGKEDINSDIGDNHSVNKSLNTEISNEKKYYKNDFESMKSNLLETKSNWLKNLILKDEENLKKLYKIFVKAFLKIKFEKIDSSHPAQKIPEKILFKECLKQEVPEEKYTEFIEREINNISKYSNFIYRKPPQEEEEDCNNEDKENIKPRPTRITRYNQRPLMEIIKEESF
jgi:hypothetical protein